MKIATFSFNAFQENTYLISDRTGSCVIIDPGCSNANEEKELDKYIEENSLTPTMVVNTHGHVDHVAGCKYVVEKYQVPFALHPDDIPNVENAKEHGLIFGFELDTPPKVDIFLEEGCPVCFGESELQVIHLPGHSAGGVGLYSESEKFLIVGDTLFRGSIGRTDLPGGNYDILMKSIKEKLLSLPGDVTVFPGHGPNTTIQHEHDTNPFLAPFN